MAAKKTRPKGRRRVRSCPTCQRVAEFNGETCRDCYRRYAEMIRAWRAIEEREERLRSVPGMLTKTVRIEKE